MKYIDKSYADEIKRLYYEVYPIMCGWSVGQIIVNIASNRTLSVRHICNDGAFSVVGRHAVFYTKQEAIGALVTHLYRTKT